MSWIAALSVPVAGVSLWSVGVSVARRIAPDLPGHARFTLGSGIGLGFFLTTVCIVARAAQAFDVGLSAAAGLGLLAWAMLAQLPPPAATATATDSAAESAELIDRHRTARRRLVWAIAAVTVLYAVVAWKYQIHDEHSIFGHKSMVEILRNGDFPPHLPPFPFEEAHYHYAFDVLAGALARAFGYSADLAIDLTTVAMAILMSLAAAAVATDLGRESSAPLAALAIHFGGGLAFAMLAGVEGRHPRCLVQYHHPSCSSELFPPPFLNVFQHPVSVGVPLWLISLLLARRVLEVEPKQSRQLAAAGLLMLLPALSLGQLVYYLLGGLGILAALPPLYLGPADQRPRTKAVLTLIAVIAGGLVLSRIAGGMLSPSTLSDPTAVFRRDHLGFPPNVNLLGILRHHAINLGIGFVLLPLIAFFALRRRRFLELSILAFACGGALVPHLWEYRYSWDIVKFPSAAGFAFALIYVLVIDARLIELSFPVSWLRRVGRLALLGTGLLAATYLIFPLKGEWLLYNTSRFEVDPLIAQTIAWWRGHDYKKEQLILAQSNVAPQLAVFGGLSVAAADYDLQTQGLRRELLSQHQALIDRIRSNLDPAAIKELGVAWLMFSTEELDNLGASARATLLKQPPVAEFPGATPRQTRRIWRVPAS